MNTQSFSAPPIGYTSLSSSVRHALCRQQRVPLHLGATALAFGLIIGWVPIAHGEPFAAELDLASLLPVAGGDGTDGFVMEGAATRDYTGGSVSAAGDVNGDGLGDLILGSEIHSGQDGILYVVFGSGTSGARFPLSSLLAANGGDGSAGFALHEIDVAAVAGGSPVSDVGDVNGDGIDDVIVGVWLASPGGRESAGQSFVIFGRDPALGQTFPAEIELASLLAANGGDGTDGFVLNGIASHDYAGSSVAGGGDVNDDGIDDLIVGAKYATPDLDGHAYVVFGRDTIAGPDFPAEIELSSLLAANGGDGSSGVVLLGSDSEWAGYAVSVAGDVSGDGIADAIVGAYRGTPNSNSYVVFGRSAAPGGSFPAEIELSSLSGANGGDGSAGFVMTGTEPVGLSVSAADVTGDGIADVVLGAFNASPYGVSRAGRGHVVFGRDVASVGFPADFALASLFPANGGDGSTGFVMNGTQRLGDAGWEVSGAGDLNSDGIDDLLIGAPGESHDGRSYVIYGRDTGQAEAFPAVLELSSLLVSGGGDGSAGFVATVSTFGDRTGGGGSDALGYSLSNAGDVNGDGLDDLLLGTRAGNPGSERYAGESYVVYGRPAGAPPPDSDGDAVSDAVDACPATVIPEAVPFRLLGDRRFALTDDDTTFNHGPDSEVESTLSTAFTRGCSCEQIIAALGLGPRQQQFGCERAAILLWMDSFAP